MSTSPSWTDLPADLPVPEDDGAADHLPGAALPPIELRATDGRTVRLDTLTGRTVVYAYPRTGEPGKPSLVEDWDQVPGARGCTPESCGFRDHHAELQKAGAGVYGLSNQDTAYQQEAATRLGLPFPLLSDEDLRLTAALRLPTFEGAGHTLLKRLTLLLHEGKVERVWYPVFPPDTHAGEGLAWAQANQPTPRYR